MNGHEIIKACEHLGVYVFVKSDGTVGIQSPEKLTPELRSAILDSLNCPSTLRGAINEREMRRQEKEIKEKDLSMDYRLGWAVGIAVVFAIFLFAAAVQGSLGAILEGIGMVILITAAFVVAGLLLSAVVITPVIVVHIALRPKDANPWLFFKWEIYKWGIRRRVPLSEIIRRIHAEDAAEEAKLKAQGKQA